MNLFSLFHWPTQAHAWEQQRTRWRTNLSTNWEPGDISKSCTHRSCRCNQNLLTISWLQIIFWSSTLWPHFLPFKGKKHPPLLLSPLPQKINSLEFLLGQKHNSMSLEMIWKRNFLSWQVLNPYLVAILCSPKNKSVSDLIITKRSPDFQLLGVWVSSHTFVEIFVGRSGLQLAGWSIWKSPSQAWIAKKWSWRRSSFCLGPRHHGAWQGVSVAAHCLRWFSARTCPAAVCEGIRFYPAPSRIWLGKALAWHGYVLQAWSRQLSRPPLEGNESKNPLRNWDPFWVFPRPEKKTETRKIFCRIAKIPQRFKHHHDHCWILPGTLTVRP